MYEVVWIVENFVDLLSFEIVSCMYFLRKWFLNF